MISWFFFFLDPRSLELSARLQNTRQCICSDWKMLENQWANLYKQILIKKITRNSLKVLFSAEEGFKVWTALLLFSVNCKGSLPTPFCEFWHVTVPFNIGMHTRRIRPIMRQITNVNPQETYLSQTLTCLCDSAGCQNELLCTSSQMDYTNGLDEFVGWLQRRLG